LLFIGLLCAQKGQVIQNNISVSYRFVLLLSIEIKENVSTNECIDKYLRP